MLWLVAFICALWAAGALYFDFPVTALRSALAILWGIAFVALVIFVPGRWRRIGSVAAGFLVILVWWFTLKPSNDGAWQPDVEQLAWAEVNDDQVTIHNVRNCDYRTETEFTPRWETQTVRLSQIAGIDLAVDYWGSPYIAHPIVSFQFADGPPICFSIEVRKVVGQKYSAIAGFYRQYALIYIVADERDVIRLRTNYRKGEDIYLYRVKTTPERAQRRFLEYIKVLNAMRAKPRWYNALTTNCTTSIREQHPPNERAPWDWRILVNGKADEMMYERGYINTDGLPFSELKTRALVNPKARAADQDPDFWRRIRAGTPGFGP